MAGHSKWANIKHRKGAQDAKRAKIFAKISKEITIAAANGGTNIDSNPSLRLALSKAKSNSMPKANIEKAISKAIKDKNSHNYKEYVYGANAMGVSFIIELLSDNHHKVTSLVQSYFNRLNGSITSPNSLNYIFERRGVIAWEKKENDNDDEMMLFALECGGLDFEIEDNIYYLYTKLEDFHKVKDTLENNGITNFIRTELDYIPLQEIKLDSEKAQKIINFIDKFEDEEEVQNIYHNLDVESFN